jgi:hypothetical protein
MSVVHRRAPIIPMIALAIMASGCVGEGSSSAANTSVRTDGAIRVVESTPVTVDSAKAWAISATPRLSIGVEDGPEHYQFSRIGSVARLDGGRIAVGDGGSSQLRLYDSAGVFITATGRPGQGPGEFGQFASLRVRRAPNGELLVDDNGNDRINVFDGDARYLRTFKLAPAPNGPRVFLVDLFADGTLLASAPDGGGRLDASVVGPLPPMQFSYLRYSPTGEYMGRVLTAVDRPRYVHAYGTIRHFPYIPLTPEPKLVARDSSVLVYRGPAAEVEQWTTSGRQEGAIRWRSGGARTVASVWDRYVAESLEDMQGEQRAQYQHYYQQTLPLPTDVPEAEALMVDEERNLWIRRYRLPWETVQHWDIFAPDGAWITALDTPDRLAISQIGRDFLLGTHRDSLGVERVQLYGLTRRMPARTAAR